MESEIKFYSHETVLIIHFLSNTFYVIMEAEIKLCNHESSIKVVLREPKSRLKSLALILRLKNIYDADNLGTKFRD